MRITTIAKAAAALAIALAAHPASAQGGMYTLTVNFANSWGRNGRPPQGSAIVTAKGAFSSVLVSGAQQTQTGWWEAYAAYDLTWSLGGPGPGTTLHQPMSAATNISGAGTVTAFGQGAVGSNIWTDGAGGTDDPYTPNHQAGSPGCSSECTVNQVLNPGASLSVALSLT